MKRIDTPTAVSGRFVDGDKTTGRKATQFSAEWCNQIQEELWNAISGLTGSDPTGLSEDELKKAFLDAVGEFILKSLTVRKSYQGATLLITLKDGKITIFQGTTSSEKTTEIDSESIVTEIIKIKKIQGLTPSGGQDFKLVVTNGLDVGTQENNAPLHVNGTTTLNGDTAVNGDQTIGSAQTNKNQTVNGNQTVTGTQTVGGKSTFNGDVDIGAAGTGNGKTVTHFGLFQQNGDVGIIGNVEIGNPQGAKNFKVYGNFEATGKSTLPSAEIYNSFKVPFHKIVDGHTSYNMTTRQGEAIGNEVTVYNEAQTDKYVNILKKNVDYEAYVQFKIKSGHAMKFICTAVDTSVASGSPGASAWTALSNDDYEGV
jgi:hypothetical protein